MQRLIDEIQKVIVSQEEMIEAMVIALLTRSHLLLEGMPGLAKTTAIKTFAKALELESKRIQFTPDLLPSDIIGAEIFSPKTNEFSIKKGPIFTNILIADEINRASPKVQSALLEAMQERQVTIAGDTIALPKTFMVLATQNPIEQEGTYPLPEAQLDRFMFKVIIDYPNSSAELEILKRSETGFSATIESIANEAQIEKMQDEVAKIYTDDAIKNYIVSLVQATREHPNTLYGASPRGSIDLLKASKAKAYLKGKEFVEPQDVLEILLPTLRHRVILSYEARAKGVTPDSLLESIAKSVPLP